MHIIGHRNYSVRTAIPCPTGHRCFFSSQLKNSCRVRRKPATPQLNLPISSLIASPLRSTAYRAKLNAASEYSVVEKESKSNNTLVLGLLFLGWYGFNTFFNIANKTVLKAVPLPFFFTTLQFAVGGALALIMWMSGLHQRPKLDATLVAAILPLAAVHTLGNLLTNVSLGKVAVSFTHTIKSMEPFFSVLLSSLFLGDVPSVPILLTLLPIVGGVIAASASEATFNWGGFLAAMGSNLTFQSRNVFSKKFMGNKKGSLDNINLFSVITILSFLLLTPVTLLKEGHKLTPSAINALGISNPAFIMRQALYAAFCFHAYQQVSYMILQRVTPVTHSIGNCLKRVIVIVASVVFFRNPVSQQNIIGTSIALLGVFLYSQVKRLANNKKKM